MMIFERTGEKDFVTHYEHFLLNYDWTQSSLPNQIGDWNLLGGTFLSDCDGPIRLSAVYRTQSDVRERVVYIDLADDCLLKMVVGDTVDEIKTELPSDVLERVLAGQGASASEWKSSP